MDGSAGIVTYVSRSRFIGLKYRLIITCIYPFRNNTSHCATSVVSLWILSMASKGALPSTSGENQPEESGSNGPNLRPTVDSVGSIRLILSTSVVMAFIDNIVLPGNRV
jgi:hypothetical protein